MKQDTIAAISTAWGESGIAIVRVSGEDACEIAGKILRTPEPLDKVEARKMQLSSLFDKPAGEKNEKIEKSEKKRDILDSVLVVRFAAPKSYTGEDIVEIHTHGGSLVSQLCLELLVRAGARIAEPGEFTKRAFLNGRIDLSQAEGVLGIIRSRSEEALKAAARTLSGELSEFAGEIHEEILNLQAKIEVGLDFPEEDTPYVAEDELSNGIETLKMELEDLLDRCKSGFLLREGIRVALVGCPNVGKSSLLNALVKQARAIVTAMPGTTRDVIEESITWHGVPIRLVDTAGIRIPLNEAEVEGVRKAREEFLRADICLWVFDGSKPIEEQGELSRDMEDKLLHSAHIFVINKIDLPQKFNEDYLYEKFPESHIISISAKKGTGVDHLKEKILEISGYRGGNPIGSALSYGLNVTARQLDEVRNALESLSAAADAKNLGGVDLIATCLAQSRTALERLLGLSSDDILLDRVFSDFCVGK
ncbi:MAG: tRNA uridine-5-carboxymethylaminomethyl(34) synthesis GTPase MnmE [Synergistaceae bacterium]|nr:tRNA uridine-5-carboxymethylaminomethyl(34) synthesis GTPase MnmE [Synergistaceae bacterium]